MHGPSPTSNSGGNVPPVLPRSPPPGTIHFCLSSLLLSLRPFLSLTLQCPSVCPSFSSLSLNYHYSHVPSSFSHLSVYPFLSLLTCLCRSPLYPLNNNFSFFPLCSLSISPSTLSL